VRKIRTPGSVRGLSGNWQSYRKGGWVVRVSHRSERLDDVDAALKS